MSEVLRYLVRSYKPLIQVRREGEERKGCSRCHTLPLSSQQPGDRSREVELSRQMYGLLVTHPAKVRAGSLGDIISGFDCG